MHRRGALALLSGAWLAGCGGTGDDVKDAPGDDPAPLALGTWWQYEVESFGGAGPITTAGERVQVASVTAAADGAICTLQGAGPLPARLQRTDTELRVVPAADDPDTLARAIGPYALLQLPLRDGQRWIAVERTVMLVDDSGGSPPVPWVVRIAVEVRAAGVLSTALGDFRGALRVTTSWTYAPPLPSSPGFGSRDDWIVPGIGIVSSTMSGYPVNGIRPYSRSWRLTDHGLS